MLREDMNRANLPDHSLYQKSISGCLLKLRSVHRQLDFSGELTKPFE